MADNTDKSFSLVVIDVDNTLIPTAVRTTFKNNFGIDLFDLLRSKSLKTLQLSIIESINKIKTLVNNENTRIALISNASCDWLDDVLCFKHGQFSILAEYLHANNIIIRSASQTMSDHLIKQFAEPETNEKKVADEIDKKSEFIARTLDKYKKDSWLWKYTTISLLIADIRRELRFTKKYSHFVKCKEIISFGDGFDEKKAVEKLSKALKIRSAHFVFVKYPTIHQLKKQWKCVKSHFETSMQKVNEKHAVNGDKSTKCYSFYMSDVIHDSDNNAFFSGIVEQMPSLSLYFKRWLETLNSNNAASEMKGVAKRIHSALLKCNDEDCEACKALHCIVINALCVHSEFHDVFVNYCNLVAAKRK